MLKLATDMLEITSNIMEINKNTLQESQNEGKALKRYQSNITADKFT